MNVAAFEATRTVSPEDLSQAGKITALTFTAENVYVGTTDGCVMMFKHSEEGDEKKAMAQDAYYSMKKVLSKSHAVKQLEAVPELQGFLALCDGVLALHDLKAPLNKQASRLELKNIHMFCVDSRGGSRRICVSVKGKKRLELYSYDEAAGKFIALKQLIVPEAPLAMAWRGDHICLGFKRDYSVMNSVSDLVTTLPVPFDGNLPSVQIINDEELLVVSTSNLGIFLRFNGEPASKNPLQFTRAPIALALCGHYVMALVPPLEGSTSSVAAVSSPDAWTHPPGTTIQLGASAGVEIFSLLDAEQKLVQTVPMKLKGAIGSKDKDKDSESAGLALTAAPAMYSTLLAQSGPQAALFSATANKVMVSSPLEVITLGLASMDRQIKLYLQKNYVNEAQQLLHKHPDYSPQRQRDFDAEAGFVRIRNLQFAAARKHLWRSRVDPREVIRLFEFASKLKDVPFIPNPKTPFAPYLTANPSMHAIIAAGKRARSQTDSRQDKLFAELKDEEIFQGACFYLTLYLWKWRSASDMEIEYRDDNTRIWVDTALLFLYVECMRGRPVRRPQRFAYGRISVSGEDGEFDGTDGAENPGPSGTGVAAVDASLDRATLAARPAPFTLKELLYPENQCALATCEPHLLMGKHYSILAELFRSKQMLVKALGIWRSLGTNHYEDAPPPQYAAAPPPRNNDEVDDEDAPHAARMSISAHKLKRPGVEETVEVLSELDSFDVICNFGEWVLQTHPEEGMKIFTSMARRTPLQPDMVLEYLGMIQKQVEEAASSAATSLLAAHGGSVTGRSSADSSAAAAGAPRLKLGGKDRPSVGTPAPVASLPVQPSAIITYEYVDSYLDHLVRVVHTRDPKYHNRLALSLLKKVLHLYQPSSAEAKERARAGEEPGLLGQTRRKLLQFLRDSNYYTKTEMLNNVMQTQLFDELAIVNSKLARHEEVLKVFVYKLSDHESAAAYCVSIPEVAAAAEEDETASEKQHRDSRRWQRDVEMRDPKAKAQSQLAKQAAREALRSEVFIYLLKLYFSSPNSTSGGLTYKERALRLLHNYAEFIQPVEALRIVPPDTNMNSLSNYLKRIVPLTLHRRRHSQVVVALSKEVHLQTNVALFDMRSHMVVITDETKCPVCGQRIKDKVFALNYHIDPNAVPVHYNCLNSIQQPTEETRGIPRRRTQALRTFHH